MKCKLLNELKEKGAEIFEGTYTKLIVLNHNEYENQQLYMIVDKLAEKGWLLSNVLHSEDNKYYYWFQSKRKIYANQLQHDK